MRKQGRLSAPARGKGWLLIPAVCCLFGSLAAREAKAASYYEANGPYRHGTGATAIRGSIDSSHGRVHHRHGREPHCRCNFAEL